MAATKQDIEEWFKQGVREKATHMIVVCDTFDWDDYPVYVKKGDDVRTEQAKRNGANMQQVMEVYNLKKPMDKQMKEGRCFSY